LFTLESIAEQAALTRCDGVCSRALNGVEIALGELAVERDDYGQEVILAGPPSELLMPLVFADPRFKDPETFAGGAA
jgi:hypothetical protein